MNNVLKLFGDRLLVRPIVKPSGAGGLLLPETESAHFDAEVVMVGPKLSEDIKVGDRVIVQKAHDTHHPGAGSQKAVHQGEVLRLISTKAVVGVLSEENR